MLRDEAFMSVSYTHLRAHETPEHLVCRLLLEKKIESVQRRFSKRFACCSNFAYCEHLTNLGLDRLELRRLRFDLIYVNKIMFGMIETDIFTFFTVNTSTVTRGYSFKLF